MRPQPAFVALLGLVGTLIWSGGCESTDDIVTSSGTLRVSVVDRDLTEQSDAETDTLEPPGGWQVMAWEIESADLVIPQVDPGTFSYVLTTSPPCVHRQLAPRETLTLDCDFVPGFFREGVGYAMEPGVPLEVSMVLVIQQMDIRRAYRPLLDPDGNYDGDDWDNKDDNCPLVPSPNQEDINGDGFGDACSLPDFNGDPTIPDRDGDRVADDSDNCLWIPNTDQTDDTPFGAIGYAEEAQNPDGIGDECERWAPIGPMPLRLDELPAIMVPIEGTQNFVTVDFNDQTAVSCDPDFTSCSVNPGDVLFTSP